MLSTVPRAWLVSFGALLVASAYEVSVTTVDLQGRPIPGATVWLSQDRLPQRAQTSSEGSCRFTGVTVGPVQIVSWKEGYAVGGRDAQVVGSAELVLVLGSPAPLAMRLISRGRNPETGDELPPDPIEGARLETVRVNDLFTVPVDDLTPLGFPSLRSGADGRLIISYLPEGGYASFRVGHGRFADTYAHYPVGQREITLQMYPGVVLRGRVTNEAGEAVEHAQVSIFRANQAALREFEEAVSDPEGFYKAILPPGDYFVTAKHIDYATPEPKSGTLKPGAPDAICDLVLPDAYALRGWIMGTDGGPVGGVHVQYLVKDVIYAQTLTTNEGAFTLEIAPGNGRIHVVAPDGYMTDRATDIEVEMDRSDVTIQEPIRLQMLPEITGIAVDETGAPVARALVAVLGLDAPEYALTNDAGRFRIRLSKLPYEAKAFIRIEHSRRFLRADVVVSLADLEPVAATLAPFEPDLKSCDPDRTTNKELVGLRGKPAPELTCDLWFNVPVGTDGNQITPTLEEMRGKVVVLNFWGGFNQSAAALAHYAELNTLYAAFQDSEDVAFLGVHDTGNEEGEIRGYIRERAIEYPVGRDADAATYDRYNIYSIPQTVLIDKKGVLRFYDIEGRLLELTKSLRREAP